MGRRQFAHLVFVLMTVMPLSSRRGGGPPPIVPIFPSMRSDCAEVNTFLVFANRRARWLHCAFRGALEGVGTSFGENGGGIAQNQPASLTTLLHLHQGLSRAICGWQVALGRDRALPVPRRHGLPGSLVNGLHQPDLEVAEYLVHLLPGPERPAQRVTAVFIAWAEVRSYIGTKVDSSSCHCVSSRERPLLEAVQGILADAFECRQDSSGEGTEPVVLELTQTAHEYFWVGVVPKVLIDRPVHHADVLLHEPMGGVADRLRDPVRRVCSRPQHCGPRPRPPRSTDPEGRGENNLIVAKVLPPRCASPFEGL